MIQALPGFKIIFPSMSRACGNMPIYFPLGDISTLVFTTHFGGIKISVLTVDNTDLFPEYRK